MSDFDPVKYKNEFSKQNYDRTTILTPKGKKELIKAAALAANQSLNEYINAAIDAYMSNPRQEVL